MALVPIDLPPGVYKNGTRYQTSGRWFDCNLIRWVDGMMRPIGGWSRVTTAPIASKARTLFAWRTNSGGRWLAVGASRQLIVTRTDGLVYDVTPAGLAPGNDDAVEQLGYGGGNYGTSTYGTARPGGTFLAPTTWQFDSWGDNLVGCARGDGKIYQWALNSGVPAALVSGAPTGCLGLIVSDQRHLVTFGAGGNRRKAQWSGKENNTLWAPAADNEAGSFEFQTSGEYMRSVRVRGQILVCTDVDAHVMNYIGQPYIFSRERVGLDCGLIGPNAITVAGSAAFWMGDKKFWLFDGSTVRPIECEVADHVFGSINLFQGTKIACGHNGAFGEVWWWYPSTGSNENDRYVIYNYRENHWSIGSLPLGERTAWHDRGVFPQTLAMGVDNHLYRHEEGWLDVDSTRINSIFAESGALELGNGDMIGHITQIIPDEQTRGEVSVRFESKFTPSGESYGFGPYLVRQDGYTDTRVSGRQVSMRLEPTVDDDFRVGKFRLDVKGGGNR